MSVHPWLEKAEYILWVLFLVTLPITSFPYFPSGLGGNTLVRPLSVYPLMLLLVIVVLPRLLKRPVTRTLLPFIIFVLFALASTLLSFTRGIDPLIGVSVSDRTIRTLVTLFLGGGFYLAVAVIPDTPERLRASLRWMFFGFGAALLWGTIQAVYVLKFHPVYFDLLSQLQRLVSIRKLFPTRISGMTYEPNWFAEQITFLLMPWLFTAVFSGYSVFRWRWRWLSVELIMLVWAIVVLIFTFSRSGMILLALQLLIVFLFRPGGKRDESNSNQKVRWKFLWKRILQASLALVVLASIVFVVGSRNNYFSRLWNYWIDDESTGQYLQYIAFDQRFTYWETAYRIFNDYPLLGIGLGNFTFYLDEYLPDYPLHPTPELLTKLTPEEGRNQLSTVKGVFPRLLAETGILGTATFLGFLFALVGCVSFLAMANGTEVRFWGLAGFLALVVFLVVSFSFDSFSVPNMWVVFGFITAASQIYSVDVIPSSIDYAASLESG
jgi:O-antigen ligase